MDDTFLHVPEPAESRVVHMSDGAEVVLRRYGRTDGERLALSHGNGLAIDAYLPFWSLLQDHFDLILFDARNHGRNPVHGFEGHTWDRIGLDMDELPDRIAEAYGAKPIAGAFHSLTSVAAVRQALVSPSKWAKLILFDPPFYPREGHELLEVQEEHLDRMTRLAERRAESFESPAQLASLLASRPQFARWVPGAHDLFARSTLRQADGGGSWGLSCPKAYEAHIFLTNRDGTVWPRLRAGLDVPVQIIGADPGLDDSDSPSKVCRALADELGIPYEFVAGTTHMLQIEAPEACARALNRALNS